MRNDKIEPRATACTATTEANRTLGEAEAQKIERRSTTSSCTKTSRRCVAALSEHRRLDGWTSTPYICSSGCSGGCDELAGERLPKQRPHLFERKKTRKKHNPTTTKEDEEHPDSSNEKHLGSRLPSRVKRQVLSCFTPAATRAKSETTITKRARPHL